MSAMNNMNFPCVWSFLFGLLICTKLILALVCYQCNNCDNVTSCTCNAEIETNVESSYCILLRENLPDGVNIEIKRVPRNFTAYDAYDPYYISVRETIFYDQTTPHWLSTSNLIVYACQADRCNQADLLKQFPVNGLSLMLPLDWLNENLLRKADKSTTSCYNCLNEIICRNAECFMNQTNCNIKNCRGSCIMGEKLNKSEKDHFNYESFCSDDTTDGPKPQPPEVHNQ